jgi:L-methionine (R)-S-oxide reductase
VQTELLDRVNSVIARGGSREDRARTITDLIRQETGRRWVGIYAVTDQEVVNLAWSGPAPPAHPSFPVAQGLSGAAIKERATVISNDVGADPRYLVALESTGSEMIVPVLLEGDVVGTLDVEDKQLGAFAIEDQRLFEEVARALEALFR